MENGFERRLLDINIPASLTGHHYLNRALELYTFKTKMMQLYEQIGKEFNKKPENIERAIRHALKNAIIDDTSIKNHAFLANYKFLYWADV